MGYPNITQDIQELQAFQANLINLVYPVGSIYMSVNNVSPATFLGGTWEQIQNRFLLSAGSSYAAGSTGGEASHTLSVAETPAHTHTRGTMEISGGITVIGHTSGVTYGMNLDGSTFEGVFSKYGSGTTNAFNNYSTATRSNGFRFDASKNWTGATSSVGGNAAHNNMPPYLTVYMWKRTA